MHTYSYAVDYILRENRNNKVSFYDEVGYTRNNEKLLEILKEVLPHHKT